MKNVQILVVDDQQRVAFGGGDAQRAQALGVDAAFRSVLNDGDAGVQRSANQLERIAFAFVNDEIDSAQQRGASLFVEQNSLTDLLKKKDSQSRYLWDLATSNDPQIAGSVGFNATNLKFHGYPVVALPNGVIINGYDTGTHPSTPFANR